MESTILVLLSLVLTVSGDKILAEGNCTYTEILSFALQWVREPAKEVTTFRDDGQIQDRLDCYTRCCEEQYQMGMY